MAKDSSEKYLDNLLNSINGINIDEDDITETSDDDFLKMFEKELDSEDYDSIMSDFELELENIEKEKSFEDILMDEDDDDSDELSLDEVLSRVESHTEGTYSIEEEDESEDVDEDSDISSLDELTSAVGSFGFEEEPDLSEEPVVESEPDDLDGFEGLEMISEPLSDIPEIGEPDLAGNSGDDLEDLLGGGFGDIGDLLSDGEVENPEGDAFEDFAEKEMSGDLDDDFGALLGEVDVDGKPKKKGGFFARLIALFFGSDDDEEDESEDNAEDDFDFSGLSEENAQILRDLEGEKEPKKSKKEKKTKEKKAKPAKPKKAKKKKEKKPPKPKKEKKPKEKDNTPPLPKVPVIMIWLLAISLFVLVMVGTKLIGSAVDMKSAKSLYMNGEYTQAKEIVAGHSLNEEGELLKQKIEILASIQSQIDSHKTFVTYNQPVDALDALICAAGRCENYKDEAKELGITAEVDALYAQIEQEFADMYNLSMDEVLEVYSIRDRNKYTIAVYRLCNKLGIKF